MGVLAHHGLLSKTCCKSILQKVSRLRLCLFAFSNKISENIFFSPTSLRTDEAIPSIRPLPEKCNYKKICVWIDNNGNNVLKKYILRKFATSTLEHSQEPDLSLLTDFNNTVAWFEKTTSILDIQEREVWCVVGGAQSITTHTASTSYVTDLATYPAM